MLVLAAPPPNPPPPTPVPVALAAGWTVETAAIAGGDTAIVLSGGAVLSWVAIALTVGLALASAGVYAYRGFRRAKLAKNQPLEVINLITALEARKPNSAAVMGANDPSSGAGSEPEVPYAVLKTSRRLDEMALQRCSSADVRDRLEDCVELLKIGL